MAVAARELVHQPGEHLDDDVDDLGTVHAVDLGQRWKEVRTHVIDGERPPSFLGRRNPSGPGEPDLEVQLLERIREEVPVVLGPLGCLAEPGASAALANKGVLRFPE